MKNYTLNQLLQESAPEHHASLRELWEDQGVHYIVLFVHSESLEKAILTVGPGHDCETLAEVDQLDLDGMLPHAYVATKATEAIPQNPSTNAGIEPGKLKEIEALEKALQERDNELKEQAERLRKKEEEVNQLRAGILEREKFLTECEERLSNLAERHLEKEAELLQREEGLRAREDALEQRENDVFRKLSAS